MELNETVFQWCVIDGRGVVDFRQTHAGVVNNLIGHLVVVFIQSLRMPLNGENWVLTQVFNENWGIVR